MAAANSINEPTTGIVGMTGAGFTASPTTPFLVQIGGTNSYELDEVAIGSSGQVLTSNGAGVAPTFQTVSAGGGLLTASGTLTSAQIKGLHGTPIQAVAAQGSGTVIVVVSTFSSFVYGGSNVFVAGASQAVSLYIGTVTLINSGVPNTIIVGTTSTSGSSATGWTHTATSSVSNVGLNWYNPVVTEISGNAANNNVINWSITYRVVAV